MAWLLRPLARLLTAALLTLAAAPLSFACSKSLTIGTIDYPPYMVWQPDGTVRGLDADLAAAALKRAGCRYQFRRVPFKRALRDVAFGMLDGMPAVSYTPERAQGGFFTVPIRHEIIAAFVRAEDDRASALTSLDDMVRSGLKVSYVLGGWHGQAFTSAIKDNATFRRKVSTVTDFDTLFKSLHARLTDVAVVDILIGREILKTHPEYGPALALAFPINADALYMTLSRKTVTQDDVTAINMALEDLRKSPEYMDIIRTYAPGDMAAYIAGSDKRDLP